jgi:hypothetical protein
MPTESRHLSAMVVPTLAGRRYRVVSATDHYSRYSQLPRPTRKFNVSESGSVFTRWVPCKELTSMGHWSSDFGRWARSRNVVVLSVIHHHQKSLVSTTLDHCRNAVMHASRTMEGTSRQFTCVSCFVRYNM